MFICAYIPQRSQIIYEQRERKNKQDKLKQPKKSKEKCI